MSLLDTASLIVTPNAYKEGKLYSVIPSDGSGDMSVVRATTATRVNSAGLVELVPYNLVQYSEQFNNAAWLKQDATITANSIDAPNGTLTADTITDNSTLDRHITYQSLDSERSLTRTLSIYAKQGTLRYLVLSVTITSDSTACYSAIFDLQTGTITATKNNGSATISASIENTGNGWYRCAISGALGSGFETIYPVIATSDRAGFTGSLSNNNLPIYAGSGQSLYIWGAQLNEGTILPYQKTETRLNIPRLDYSNGTCPSLLVEPQRTNLLTYSSSFDNAAWIKFNASISANVTATLDPSGNYGASKIVEDSSSSFHDIDQVEVYSAGANTISVYAKAAGRNHIFLQHFDGSSFLTSGTFNLSNGTVSGNGTIQSVGNGWYRCSFTATTVNGTGKSYINLSNGTTGNYQGDGTSGVYVYGAQLELGSYATSYIPTTSASVTRNSDVISKTGISSLIGQTEGTLFLDVVLKNPFTSINRLFSITETVWNVGGSIRIEAESNKFTADFVNAGSSMGKIEFFTTVQQNTRYKIAVAYKQNDCQMYINGTNAGSDTTTAAMPTCSELYLNALGGGFVAAYDANNINAAALWKTRLTNAQLATLTTI